MVAARRKDIVNENVFHLVCHLPALNIEESK